MTSQLAAAVTRIDGNALTAAAGIAGAALLVPVVLWERVVVLPALKYVLKTIVRKLPTPPGRKGKFTAWAGYVVDLIMDFPGTRAFGFGLLAVTLTVFAPVVVYVALLSYFYNTLTSH